MGVVLLNRREVLKTSLTAGVVSLLAGCGRLLSQAPVTNRIPRIGYLGLSPAPAEEAFRLGLRELGYVEGENIVVEWRRADGQEDRLPQLAKELLRLDLDVLVTRGTIETRIAKQA